MHRLQELVRLHRMGLTCHQVAAELGMSPNTERPYRAAFKQAGLLDGDPNDLPDIEVLKAAVEQAMPDKGVPPQCQTKLSESVLARIEQLAKEGAKPRAIYDRLRSDDPQFRHSPSAVKRAYKRIYRDEGVLAKDVAIPLRTPAGQEAQIDFGYIRKRYDAQGVLRKTYVFVMTLSYSRHMFAALCFDQSISTWLRMHDEAFEFFGGVPEVVVPDNLKSAVIKAAFSPSDETTLNRSYRDHARHYGFRIAPTPPYAPEKKGKVERGVRYLKENFVAARPDITQADDLNALLRTWLIDIAGQRIHGTTQERPLERFEREHGALRPLPEEQPEHVLWSKADVHQNSHIVVGKPFYSVPWRLIGKAIWARTVKRSVELYWDDTRVATHPLTSPGEWSTLPHHLPEGRKEYRHRSREYWLERADEIGPEAGSYIRE